MMVLFLPVASYAQARDVEKQVEVSSFDEFTSSLDQMQSTGGTIVLTQDITVPADGAYTYNNARYRKEVIIETNGHTIHVEGYLDFWPFLTIRGDGSQKELFHVYSGGTLQFVSICLDAGENGIAVIQDEGSFLMYASQEDMGLPAFSCTGQILSSQTTTAAAYWRYNCEKLPIVLIPDGADFTADLLPDQVLSVVNRDQQEQEEEVPVVWDETTFPTEHKRTLVQGKFADGYSAYKDYLPQCLVIWESDTDPFFLNVYLKSATQWYDMVFMYGQSPQPGTVYVQSSMDGETWEEITGTDGYTPMEVEQNNSFLWILSYEQSELAPERPKYYRLLQILDDGTELSSNVLELTNDFIFTAADIEGGRGGETSPSEGENQLPNDMPGTEGADEPPSLESTDPTLESEMEPEDSQSAESPNSNDWQVVADDPFPDETLTDPPPEESAEAGEDPAVAEKTEPAKADYTPADNKANYERTTGIAIVICILLVSVGFSIFKIKNKP